MGRRTDPPRGMPKSTCTFSDWLDRIQRSRDARAVTNETPLRVTGWSNGSPGRRGAGYGVRLSHYDRDHYFDRGWREVMVSLDSDEIVAVPLSKSFWRSCPELRSAAIGRWLLRHRLAPWPHGHPPAVLLRHVVGNCFELQRPS